MVLPVLVCIISIIVLSGKPRSGPRDIYIIGGCLFTFCIGGLLLIVAGTKEHAQLRKELGTIPEFNKQTGEFKLYKRSEALRQVITIKEDKNYVSHVTPTKTYIGAVTVGGVTTGGTYTTGGERVIDRTEETGRHYLHYTNVFFITAKKN